MFLNLSVILFTGGGVHPTGQTPPADTPSWQTLPWADIPPSANTSPLRQPLQRMLLILLKCILDFESSGGSKVSQTAKLWAPKYYFGNFY